MNEYNVTSLDAKQFILLSNNLEIGKLVYESWFSNKAQIILTNISTYKIEPKGFWGTSLELIKNHTVLANIKMNWNGHIVISTLFNEIPKDYALKKGILKDTFILTNKNNQELLKVIPDFNWKKLNYNYKISINNNLDISQEFNDVFLFTIIHCANYYMTMTSSFIPII